MTWYKNVTSLTLNSWTLFKAKKSGYFLFYFWLFPFYGSINNFHITRMSSKSLSTSSYHYPSSNFFSISIPDIYIKIQLIVAYKKFDTNNIDLFMTTLGYEFWFRVMWFLMPNYFMFRMILIFTLHYFQVVLTCWINIII